MNKFFLTLIFIFPLFLTSYAQEYLHEYGKIAKAEFDLKEYAPDNTAEAVVLFDIGKSYFMHANNGFEVFFDRTIRIKILSEAGLRFAEAEIAFYRHGDVWEKVHKIEGTTYNFEHGKIIRTPLDADNCFDQKINEAWNLKKFAMPNVKVGSIIEYKYRVESEHIFNLRDWEFQWEIPNLYSEYQVASIPFYQYTWLLQGTSVLDEYETFESPNTVESYGGVKYKEMNSKFVMKDLPAFKDEVFITSKDDYLIKIDFQLSKFTRPDGTSTEIVSTWPKMIEDLIDDTDHGGYINKSERLAKKLFDVKIITQLPDAEKFNFVMDFVKHNYSWNGKNDKFARKSPNDFLKEKMGNSAELNLFAIGLLNAVGIESHSVIISTRGNGRISADYPFNHFFNYVIVVANVEGKLVLTDATQVNNSNFRIPARCINDKGLIIQKSKDIAVKWISLVSKTASTIQTVFEMKLFEDNMDVGAKQVLTEYDALDYRNNFGADAELIKESLTGKGYNVKEKSIEVLNNDSIQKPYILNFQLSEELEAIGDKIYLSPFSHETLDENPLKQKTRTYPVDMIYPTIRKFYTTIEIPEGYVVDFLPQKESISSQYFDMNYMSMQKENTVTVSFNYHFKLATYEPSIYPVIKHYFARIIAKENEKVVLKKL